MKYLGKVPYNYYNIFLGNRYNNICISKIDRLIRSYPDCLIVFLFRNREDLIYSIKYHKHLMGSNAHMETINNVLNKYLSIYHICRKKYPNNVTKLNPFITDELVNFLKKNNNITVKDTLNNNSVLKYKYNKRDSVHKNAMNNLSNNNKSKIRNIIQNYKFFEFIIFTYILYYMVVVYKIFFLTGLNGIFKKY